MVPFGIYINLVTRLSLLWEKNRIWRGNVEKVERKKGVLAKQGKNGCQLPLHAAAFLKPLHTSPQRAIRLLTKRDENIN